MIGTFGAATRARLPWETPPISGAPNQQPWETPPIAPTPEEMSGYGRAGGEVTAQDKPSFLAPGGTGRTIAGYIGDYLSQMGGGHPIFQQIQMQKMQDERAQKQSILARQLEMADWQAKEAYKAKNPAPFRFESNSGDQIEIGSDGQPRTLYKDPTPKVNWTAVTNPDGTKTLIPIPQGGMPPVQPQVIQQLPPGVKPYGQGGAGQQAPRTFR